MRPYAAHAAILCLVLFWCVQGTAHSAPLVTREDELQQLYPLVPEERFATMDQDKSGAVSWDEYKSTYNDVDERLLRTRFEIMDENESNDLNWYEMSKAPASRAIAELEFTELDEDASGTLSFEEFSRFYPNLDREDRMEKFTLLDFDGNGMITAEEWKAIAEIP